MSAFANPALLKALEKTFGIKCNVNDAMPLSVVLRQATALAKEAEKEDLKAKKFREREDKKIFGYGTKRREKLLVQLAKFHCGPNETNGASIGKLESYLRISKTAAKKPNNKALVEKKTRDFNAERSAQTVRQIENQTHRWTKGGY